MQPTIQQLKDSILLERYKIEAPLAEGAFGKIYSGVDLLDNCKPIVIKLSKYDTVL